MRLRNQHIMIQILHAEAQQELMLFDMEHHKVFEKVETLVKVLSQTLLHTLFSSNSKRSNNSIIKIG